MTRTQFVLAIKIWGVLASLLFGGPSDATFRVSVQEGNGVTAHGTGTAISANHIVTNSHVINHRAGNRCTVSNATGRHAGIVIAADPGTDLAIVQVATGGLSSVPVAESDPKAGDRVAIYGFGRSGVLRGGTGTVLPIVARRSAGCPLIETDMGIEEGDSGSGLFSAAGELCAVQWGKDAATTRSCATPVSCLRTLSTKWEAQSCSNGQCLPWSRGYRGIGIVGPRGGAVGIGSVSPARPLVPVRPPNGYTPAQPQPPNGYAQQPIQPQYPGSSPGSSLPSAPLPGATQSPVQPPAAPPQIAQPQPGSLPPAADLAAVLARLDALASQVAELQARPGLPGETGSKGDKGDTGQRGETGATAQLTQADITSIASAVVASMRPISVVFEDDAGAAHATVDVSVDGGELRIPASRLLVITESGEIQRTGKPLGEPLRIQTKDIPVAAPK